MSQPIASYAVETNDADQTRALGEDLGRVLAAGDLVMLSGGLGAGKTTLTQGIGVGMGVRGRVASPTFIASTRTSAVALTSSMRTPTASPT